MKTKLISLFVLWSCISAGVAADKFPRTAEIPVKPLIEILDNGGLEKLVGFFNNGGDWPKISTDSFAARQRIHNQKELVALSDRLLRLIQDRAKAEMPAKIEELESEAGLFFSMADGLWKADGYRNRAMAVLCSEFASYRCGQIVILTKGEKMGPSRPGVLDASKAVDLLNLFVKGIPEIEILADSGLKEKLEKAPVSGGSWLEMLVAISKTELNGSVVGERFRDQFVLFRGEPIAALISKEDLCSLVFHEGWSHVIQDSMLPALAMYLKNNGSLDTLRKEPANATKFEAVMKNAVFRFTTAPVMSGRVGGDRLGSLVADLESRGGIAKRLFGTDK